MERMSIAAVLMLTGILHGPVLAGPDVPPDVVKVLQGPVWGWAREESSVSCENNPHTIKFDLAGSRIVLRFRKPIHGADGKFSNLAVYNILGSRGKTITMQIVGEKRLGPDGKSVAWDLIVLDDRTYVWRRIDWPESSHTPYIRRCR